MLGVAIGILITVLVVIGGLGLLIYVIVNRIQQKEKENFPKRDD